MVMNYMFLIVLGGLYGYNDVMDEDDYFENIIGNTRLKSSLLMYRNGQGHEWVKSTCAVSHRYMSSTISAWMNFREQFLNPNLVFPISSRIRDLTITRNRCIEETAVTIFSIARSFEQIASGQSVNGIVAIVDDLMIASGGLARMIRVKEPVIEIAVLLGNGNDGERRHLELIVPHGGAQVKDRRVIGFDLNIVEDILGGMKKFGRKEFLFFQSINANWFDLLVKDDVGFKLMNVLVNMRSNMARRNGVGTCMDEKFSNFLRVYVQSGGVSDSAEHVIAQGLETLIQVQPECSMYIATAIALIQDGFTRVLLESQDGGVLNDFQQDMFYNDLSNLMEMEWQTIAGEKMEWILGHELPIFELMRITWNRLKFF